MSDNADIVREALRLSHRATDAWDAAYRALDALVAERDAALGIETEVILDDLRAAEAEVARLNVCVTELEAALTRYRGGRK